MKSVSVMSVANRLSWEKRCKLIEQPYTTMTKPNSGSLCKVTTLRNEAAEQSVEKVCGGSTNNANGAVV